MDITIGSIVGGFLITIITVVWNTSRIKGSIEERLSVIELDIKYIKHNGISLLDKKIDIWNENNARSNVDKETRIRELEKQLNKLNKGQ